MRRKKKRITVYGLATATLCVTLFIMPFSGCIVNRCLVYPSTLDDAWKPSVGKEVFFDDARSGARLHGVLLEAENPRGHAVYFHGNADNVADWVWTGDKIREILGVTIFVWDYPGFGKSTGKTTPKTLLSASESAVRTMSEQTGIPPSDMIMIGYSLGGAAAADAACRFGAKALVIDSSFTSLPAMTRRYVAFLPWRWLLAEHLDTEAKLVTYCGVVAVSHGTNDRVVPYEFGERLYEVANEPKIFFSLDGYAHNTNPKLYYTRLETFLATNGVLNTATQSQ